MERTCRPKAFPAGFRGIYDIISEMRSVTVLMAAVALVAQAEAFPPPCDPVPVKKPVKVVRREIKVSIVGEARMNKPKDLKWDVQKVIDYWYEAMDREIGEKPDLVVLPEGIDN